jgi:uncharacterized membrane protein YjgN (DUF898 family)
VIPNATPLELVLLFLVACIGLPSIALTVVAVAEVAMGAIRSWRRVRLARYRYEQIVLSGSFEGPRL